MRTRDFFVSAASQVKLTPCVLAAIISVLCVADAKASPVTYTESATVVGSLNGVSFSNALLTLTGTGDTTNITNPSSDRFFNDVTASFSLTGGASGTFTDTIFVFDIQQVLVAAGFFDNNSSGDILDTRNAAFFSYALSTSIGPITGPSVLSGDSFRTSVGTLFINLAGDATFTAVVTPLPAALPLFATGLGGLGLLGWRRKRKAQA